MSEADDHALYEKGTGEAIVDLLNEPEVPRNMMDEPVFEVPVEVDYLGHGATVAHATYQQIIDELAHLRAEKQRVQERINDLVEAEQLWAPIVHRLDNGIPRRKSDD